METNPIPKTYSDYQTKLLKEALRPQKRAKPSDHSEEWLDGIDVQKIFKISRSTLYRLRKAEKIPYMKLKGKCVYPRNLLYRTLLIKAVEMLR